MDYHFLLFVSLTRGLRYFLPVHQEILKPGPTVSHGDLLEEVSHSSVILPLLFHLSPSRMNNCPVSILRIKEEAHLSAEAELPGSTDVSIIFTPTCHPTLQGERVCPPPWQRAQPLDLTDSLPHLGPPPLSRANLALFSPTRPVPSTGLLGKDQYPPFYFLPKNSEGV